LVRNVQPKYIFMTVYLI